MLFVLEEWESISEFSFVILDAISRLMVSILFSVGLLLNMVLILVQYIYELKFIALYTNKSTTVNRIFMKNPEKPDKNTRYKSSPYNNT